MNRIELFRILDLELISGKDNDYNNDWTLIYFIIWRFLSDFISISQIFGSEESY
jgi:hypothetical protein